MFVVGRFATKPETFCSKKHVCASVFFGAPISGSGFRFAEPLCTAPGLPVNRFTGSQNLTVLKISLNLFPGTKVVDQTISLRFSDFLVGQFAGFLISEPEPEPLVRTSGVNLSAETGSHSSLNGSWPLLVCNHT